jgi:hypothetical protein
MQMFSVLVGNDLCSLSHLIVCFVPSLCVLSKLSMCFVSFIVCFVTLLGLSIRNACIRKIKLVKKSLSKPAAYGRQAEVGFPNRESRPQLGKSLAGDFGNSSSGISLNSTAGNIENSSPSSYPKNAGNASLCIPLHSTTGVASPSIPPDSDDGHSFAGITTSFQEVVV